jgi:drug/metabolite transporter (DMT)-like permease
VSQHLYLLFPLSAAALYAIAVTALKRAMADGMGPWRITFAANLVMGAAFQIPLCFSDLPVTAHSVTASFFPGILFFLGQIFTFLALSRGDVSIATPVLGTKVLLVAFFTVFVLHEPVPAVLWIGAVLSVIAILLLQKGSGVHRGRVLITIGYGVMAAIVFALADVLVQRDVPTVGFAPFVSGMFGVVALLSFGLIPFFHGPILRMPRGILFWLLLGSAILSGQCMLMAFGIGKYGHATAINIAYSARGVFSVILVWVAGHWFDNAERDAGRSVLLRRLAGAALLLSAILLILF